MWTTKLTNRDRHAHIRDMFKNGWQQRWDFSFCLCLSSRHPFIVHRLTRTCTIDTLRTSTHIYAYNYTHSVNPWGNHFYSLCLTNCFNGYFSFDHAYRIIQASIAFLYGYEIFIQSYISLETSVYVKRNKIELPIITHRCFFWLHTILHFIID